VRILHVPIIVLPWGEAREGGVDSGGRSDAYRPSRTESAWLRILYHYCAITLYFESIPRDVLSGDTRPR